MEKTEQQQAKGNSFHQQKHMYCNFPVCRALGLPCRSVTNFVSAHDTNASLTCDKFFASDGRELTSKV